MYKVKLSTSLASIALIASMFAGLATFLTVVALMIIFCEIDNIKGVIVRVTSFYLGLILVQTAWNLIFDGYTDLFYGGINSIVDVINSYLDKPVDITKLFKYVLTPIKTIMAYLDTVVSYFITFSKFAFVVALLSNKAPKQNFFTNFINKFVDKVITFVNGIDASNM